MKRKFFFLFIIILSFNKADSQNLSFGRGIYYFDSKTKTPIIGQFNQLDNLFINPVRFEFRIKNIMYSLSFQKFEGWTEFYANGTVFLGFGTSLTNIVRFDFDTGYDLFANNEKLFISPFIKFSLLKSNPTAFGIDKSFILPIGYDPNYVGTRSVQAFDDLYFIMGLGINFKWNFIDRFCLFFDVNHTFGFASFQDYILEYEYNGEVQPNGEFYTDGTALIFSIGIGIDLK